MLAMVLVDQREVIIVARILRPFVQLIETPEGKAQPLDLPVAHAVEVHALHGFAAFVMIGVGIAG